jgi:putative intracellular protease/amidase
MSPEKEEKERRRVGILLFEGFEPLDVFGPLEFFGIASEHFELVTLAQTKDPVLNSKSGLASLPEFDFDDCPQLDILLVPGGGTST